MAGHNQEGMDPTVSMLLIGGIMIVLIWVMFNYFQPHLYYLWALIKFPQAWIFSKLGFIMSDAWVNDYKAYTYDLGDFITHGFGNLSEYRTACETIANQATEIDTSARSEYYCTQWTNVQYMINGQDFNELVAGRPVERHIMGAVEIVGQISRFLYGIPILVIAYLVYSKNPQLRFTTQYNLDKFKAFQAKAWKMIAPTVKFDPLTDKKHIWDEALSPKDWVEKENIEVHDIAPDREHTRNSLSKQLKTPWAGANRLEAHERALLAAFALKIVQKNAECTELLSLLSQSWVAHGSVKKAMKSMPALRKQIDTIIADEEMGLKILKYSRNHSFVESAFANMLDAARERGGVLASAEFLWLKAEDRGLWYVLNGVGRPTYHMEGAGAIAHWKAERATGRPLPEPDVDEAVFGLEEYYARNYS